MDRPLFTFTTPLNVNIVEMKDGEHLFVEGDISTNDIDLVNDIMTKHCQESMQKQILEKNLKLDLEHEAFRGETTEEKEINKTRIPAGKLVDAVVKDLGKGRYSTRVKGEINRFSPRYETIKGNLIEKYLDAFSVAFLPIDISYEKRGEKSVRMLNDVILLNVAMTGNPCNTKAQMIEVFTKSMDAVEEYKKLKELDPTIESKLVVKDKSHSTEKSGDITKLKKNSKMTEKKNEDGSEEPEEGSEETENVETEAKSLLVSMSAEMKTLSGKYEAMEKDNVSLKESVTAMSKELAKISEALSKPVHKSPGVQAGDAEAKAKSNVAEGKSVDPLSLF